MDRETLKKFRELLEARLQETQALDDAAGDDRATVTLDQQSVGRLSRMDAMQQQAMAQATSRRRRLEVQRMENALNLIAEGEYGYCAACGGEIALRRLETDPTATRCIDCAS